jgi:hypothetical protein
MVHLASMVYRNIFALCIFAFLHFERILLFRYLRSYFFPLLLRFPYHGAVDTVQPHSIFTDAFCFQLHRRADEAFSCPQSRVLSWRSFLTGTTPDSPAM